MTTQEPMTTQPPMTNKPSAIPAGYTTVTPWIIGHDTDGLLAFITKAFGAAELFRLADENGRIGHAEARIGDAVVMAFDSPPEAPATPAYLRLFVADCRGTFDAAIASGAEPHTRPTDLAFGDRVARVRDPFGNLWWIQQRLEELDLAEIERRSALPEYAEAMRYVQSRELIATRPLA